MSEKISFDLRHPKPLLIIISGPSGVGKDTVVDRLRERNLPFHFVVTATSRPPRPGERDGIDYIFLTNEQFEKMIRRDEFIEYALVYSQYKGVPRSQFTAAMQAGKDMIMRVDVQGAAKFRQLFKEAVLIFLTPSSEEEWRERLISRGSESDESLQIRLQTVQKEINQVGIFDYIVENPKGKLDQTVDTIIAIIHAEHHRVKHREIQI